MKIARGKYEEVVEEMKKAEFKMLISDEWQIDVELVLKRESIFTKEWDAESRDNPVTIRGLALLRLFSFTFFN